MDDFLTKPLRDAELCAILRQHLAVSAVPAVNATTVMPTTNDQILTPAAPTAPAVIEAGARDLLVSMPGSAPGTTLFDELTRHFRGEFAERFDALVADVMGGDSTGTAQKSHALKGSAQTLGMQALGIVLGQVECCARANDLGGALQHLGAIEHEWCRVFQVLDSGERINV
jgi:HPt (histidine-containing phosphotransfer) domain-containing protein